jgi:hypothetical protein
MWVDREMITDHRLIDPLQFCYESLVELLRGQSFVTASPLMPNVRSQFGIAQQAPQKL